MYRFERDLILRASPSRLDRGVGLSSSFDSKPGCTAPSCLGVTSLNDFFSLDGSPSVVNETILNQI